MALPLILARSFREAHAFAKERLDLRVGHYRVVNDAGTIKAVRGTQLYLVPGWDKRPDRFKMQGAIRYCRLEIVDIAEQDKTPAPADPRGDLTERQLEVAHRYNALRDLAEQDATKVEITVVPDSVEPMATCVECGLTPCSDDCPTSNTLETPEPAEKPKARRRSKCKRCGVLHYKDEPCPSDGE